MEPATPLLFFLGASHHTAPLAVREKLALDADRAAALGARLQATAGIREFAFVNTCNRVEFYGVAEHITAIARLQDEFCAFQDFPSEEFARIRLLKDHF